MVGETKNRFTYHRKGFAVFFLNKKGIGYKNHIVTISSI